MDSHPSTDGADEPLCSQFVHRTSLTDVTLMRINGRNKKKNISVVSKLESDVVISRKLQFYLIN